MILIPSRNRPHLIKRFMEVYSSTKAKSIVVVRLDRDDPTLELYHKLNHPKFRFAIGDPIGCPRSVNELCEAFPDAPNYLFMADDTIPKTDYWDAQLAEAAEFRNISFSDSPNEFRGIRKKFWGNTSQKVGRKMWQAPCHPCIGGDLVHSLGWFFHPAFTHYWADEYLHNIGIKYPDRYIFVEDVYIDHLRETDRIPETREKRAFQMLMDDKREWEKIDKVFEST